MNKTFGLLGEKLEHSFSPMIHGYLGDYPYMLYEVDPGNLDSFMCEKQFDAINVTIPYKQAVIPYCATLSDEARMIGSVNTIVKGEDGALHGHNTDYHGFRVMLRYGGIDPDNRKVLVLGDGGSARTVRAALADLGAREIVTISRRGENHYGNIERHHDAEIIVNTTPVGMYPDNGASLVSLAGFGRLEGVADLIYNPLRTKLLLDAGRIGVPAVNGLIMLIAQAEIASRLFLASGASRFKADDLHPHSASQNRNSGLRKTAHPSPLSSHNNCSPAPIPMDADRPFPSLNSLLRQILKKIQNVAIIGMPGCGKSTVGLALAQMMGLPCVNIDERIEAVAGKTIPEIFAQEGEEAFRLLETRILAEEARKSGMVIATGGGVVTRPENFDLLRQNSCILYLRRDLSELEVEGRPLSQREGVQALAGQRLQIYEAWSDYTVDAEANPERTAAKIFEMLAG